MRLFSRRILTSTQNVCTKIGTWWRLQPFKRHSPAAEGILLPYQDGPSPPRWAAHHQEPAAICRAGEHHQVSISAGAFDNPGPSGLHPTSLNLSWSGSGTLWSLTRSGASIPAFTPQAMFKPIGRRLPVETIRSRAGTGNRGGFQVPDDRSWRDKPWERPPLSALEPRYPAGNLRADTRFRGFCAVRPAF